MGALQFSAGRPFSLVGVWFWGERDFPGRETASSLRLHVIRMAPHIFQDSRRRLG